jgi:hypothetical protein
MSVSNSCWLGQRTTLRPVTRNNPKFSPIWGAPPAPIRLGYAACSGAVRSLSSAQPVDFFSNPSDLSVKTARLL